jgi:hypothetical protein
MSDVEWDDDALRRLLDEYKRAEMTQKQLGEKYGVHRYKMGVLLRLARDKFGRTKPDNLAAGLYWKSESQQSEVKEN